MLVSIFQFIYRCHSGVEIIKLTHNIFYSMKLIILFDEYYIIINLLVL